MVWFHEPNFVCSDFGCLDHLCVPLLCLKFGLVFKSNGEKKLEEKISTAVDLSIEIQIWMNFVKLHINDYEESLKKYWSSPVLKK